MSPSAIAHAIHQSPIERVPARERPEPGPSLAANGSFLTDVLLENHHIQGTSRLLDVIVALIVHVTLISAPILAGLYYTDTLNIRQFATTLLVAPPPPPPPAAPAGALVKAAPPKRVFMNNGKLIAPTYIPRSPLRSEDVWSTCK